MAEPHDDLGDLGTDADRRRVIDQLRRQMATDRISLEGVGSPTIAGPEPVPARVVPAPPAGAQPRPRPSSPSADLMSIPAFRVHLFLWLVFSAFWLVIWLGSVMATGGWVPFWPVFPIAAFGLSVGIHAAVRKGLSP
jgi:hypothetical protein